MIFIYGKKIWGILKTSEKLDKILGFNPHIAAYKHHASLDVREQNNE